MAGRVLDLTRYLPGPLAGRILCDLGYPVVRIVPPAGDPTADHAPQLYAWLHQGKEHRVLDFQREPDRAAFLDLVSGADIVLESFRPGVMERFGLSASVLRRYRPNLTYVALRGHRDPARQALPGHDLTYLAASGVLDRCDPAWRQLQLADVFGALWAVMAALRGQLKGGGVFEVYLDEAVQVVGYPRIPAVDGSRVCYNVYATASGRVVLAALEPQLWSRFCQEIGQPAWEAHHEAPARPGEPVWEALQRVFRQRTAAAWEAWARPLNLPVCAVRSGLDRPRIPPWAEREEPDSDPEAQTGTSRR